MVGISHVSFVKTNGLAEKAMRTMAQPKKFSIVCGEVAPPWCHQCGTDQFLLIESVAPCSRGIAGVVGLGYSCLECEGFAAHCVRISDVGDTLSLMVGAMRR